MTERLTVFYDGYCPLCVAEMQQLASLDSKDLLNLEDIQVEDFQGRYPDIDPDAASRILHAKADSGRMYYGLDVTVEAWSRVGRKKWLRILRWPVIRWFADLAYLAFARNRYSISWLLTGQARCERCALKVSSKD